MNGFNPKILRLKNSELSENVETQLRLGEILQDAVWANPWRLRWEVGSSDDIPSSETSICAYHNLLLENMADFLVLSCDNPDGSKVIAGYAIGVSLTEELIQQTHIGEGLDLKLCRECLNGYEGPKVGDFYLAVTAIQGNTGVNDEPRQSFRGLRIKGCSVYRLLIELRLRLGFSTGSKTFWVRTATGQEIVRGIYNSIGFTEVGQSKVKQGETSVERTVMAGHYSNLGEISKVSNSIDGIEDWVSVE